MDKSLPKFGLLETISGNCEKLNVRAWSVFFKIKV